MSKSQHGHYDEQLEAGHCQVEWCPPSIKIYLLENTYMHIFMIDGIFYQKKSLFKMFCCESMSEHVGWNHGSHY